MTEMHKSVTVDRIIQTITENDTTLSNVGICIACGEDRDDCEPDAREYVCDECDEEKVYGAEELLLMIA
jgi:hypothetical protein